MNSLSVLEASVRLMVLQTECGRKLLRLSVLGEKDKSVIKTDLYFNLDALNVLLTSSEKVMLQAITKDLDSFASLQDAEYILLESAKSLRSPCKGRIEPRWVLGSKQSKFDEDMSERCRVVISKFVELRQLVKNEQELLSLTI